jgi:hypothetical protein
MSSRGSAADQAAWLAYCRSAEVRWHVAAIPSTPADVDIVFLQNPFDHLARDSDVEGMSDGWDHGTACEQCLDQCRQMHLHAQTRAGVLLPLHEGIAVEASSCSKHAPPDARFRAALSKLVKASMLLTAPFAQTATTTWPTTRPWAGRATRTPCASSSSTRACSTCGETGPRGSWRLLLLLLLLLCYTRVRLNKWRQAGVAHVPRRETPRHTEET